MSTNNQRQESVIYEPIQCGVYTVTLDSDVGDPDNHRDLLNVLYTAKQNDIVNIMINSHGGYLHTAIQVVDAIKRCEAAVIGHLVGVGYSAGSMIFLACDGWSVSPLASFMAHTESSGSIGKAPDRFAAADFQKKFNKKLLNEVYQGFLTQEEIEEVHSGKDFWFDSEEILDRLENLEKFREEQSNALQEELSDSNGIDRIGMVSSLVKGKHLTKVKASTMTDSEINELYSEHFGEVDD